MSSHKSRLRTAILDIADPEAVARKLWRLTDSKDNRVRLRSLESIIRIAGLDSARGKGAADGDDRAVRLNFRSALSNADPDGLDRLDQELDDLIDR